MKILSLLLYIIGIGFCIAGFTGHVAAWAAAAMCFFAATATVTTMRKKTRKER